MQRSPPGSILFLANVEFIRQGLLHTLSLTTGLVGIAMSTLLIGIPRPHSHRIRELRLHCINKEMVDLLFQLPFNHLEELDLTMENRTWIVFPQWGVQAMPVLQALYIDSTSEYWLRPMLSLPWTQLTELDIADLMTPNNILTILHHSQRLIRGTFKVQDKGALDTDAPINMPHLAFLSLSHTSPINMTRFLSLLTLPSMTHFEMMDASSHDDLRSAHIVPPAIHCPY